MALRLFLALVVAAVSLQAQDAALLILHKGSSSLGFYTNDGKLVASVPVGAHPHEMVLSSDARYVYTTDNGTMKIEQEGTGGNTVSIVDIPGRKKVGEISTGKFRRPHGIDLDRKTGNLLVSCELPDQLLVIDPARRAVIGNYDTKGKTSHMVTIGRDGRWAFVSNSSSSNVSALDLSSGAVKPIPTGTRPEGSALSKDGQRLYVVNREAEQITIIDTVKKEAVDRIKTGKGPVRVALTPDSRLVVFALMHENAVEFADAATRKVVGKVGLGGSPVSLSISPDGQLAFASAQDIDIVYVISIKDRKVVREIKTAAGAGPDPVLALR
jgi:YVTN family beta-propeller protein